ncbi:MAG: hypothetical protein QOK37_4677 [Thermoanaerobaculia bacterium]|jgi:hypothetical protein|nr:hypothetical protein [Thermoanaerobaculia bacterium]
MRKTILAFIVTLTAASALAQVVATRSSASQLLIPAAGAVDGGNGTFFRSDITLINYRASVQRVRLQWLPQNASGVGVPAVETSIAASSGIASEDFVTNIMQRTGLGAILVTSITSGGDPDPAAQLVATSRIWSNLPGSSGTTSQSLPSVATADINSATQTILSSRRDSRYRTNAGIVNLSQDTQRFQVFAAGSGGTDVQQIDVQPMSMVLFLVSGAASSIPLQIQVSNISPTLRSPSWIAYASSVDNITGDAWSTLGSNQPSGNP